jgi:hypothetical protein
VELEILLVLLFSKRVCIPQGFIVQVNNKFLNGHLISFFSHDTHDSVWTGGIMGFYTCFWNGGTRKAGSLQAYFDCDATASNTESNIDSKGPEGWKREGEVSLSGSMTRQVCGIIAPCQELCVPFGGDVISGWIYDPEN